MPFESRDLLERWPHLYLRLARLRHRDRVVGRDTDLLIEGFPRSANTFAVTALRFAQARPVSLAHHVHTAAHVSSAVDAGVPALVLVRPPRQAIVSAVIRKPSLVIGELADRYASFHHAVRPLTEHVEVATFDQVTTDYGAVISRINARFGTEFVPFDHTDENVAACFAQVDELSQKRTGGALDGSVVARPSSQKHDRRDAVYARYDVEVPSELRAELDEIYNTFAELARQPQPPK